MGTARGGRLHKFGQEYRCGTLQPGGAANPTRGSVLLIKLMYECSRLSAGAEWPFF